jgi:2-polyprenyl-6-hydroxyphenyl methylase/3-demethylubiquinone-9 3-methyltransferase
MQPQSTTESFDLWGFHISSNLIDTNTRTYLLSLPKARPTVQWVWREMDRVWNEALLQPEVQCNIHALFRYYYSHPVWILNGIFTSIDPLSVNHRTAIATYVESLSPKHVVDYGGGFGALAKILSEKLPESHIEIFEPFASALGQAAIRSYSNIIFIDKFGEPCDVMIAQDVLEHVEDPVELAIEMVQAVKPGGYLIFANCFWPVIKCHLPQTFYLRHYFRYIMRGLRLEFIGTVNGAKHAEIYLRPAELNLDACRKRVRSAKFAGSPLSAVEDFLRSVLCYIRGR